MSLPLEPSLARILDDLHRRLDDVERSAPLRSAAIGDGGLRVRGGAIVILNEDDVEMMRLSTEGLTLQGLLEVLGRLSFRDQDGNERVSIRGVFNGEGNIAYRSGPAAAEGGEVIIGAIRVSGVDIAHGLLIQRADGQDLLRAWSGENDQLSLRYLQADANAVRVFVADGGDELTLNTSAGNASVWLTEDGLRRPRMPISFGFRTNAVPDGDWVTLATGRCIKVSSHVRARVTALLVAGNSMQFRLRETFGNTTIDTVTLSASGAGLLEGPNPENFNADCRFVVEARRSAGAATTNLGHVDAMEQLIL